MNFETLINKLPILPMNKAIKLLEDYQEKIGFKTFAEQQRALDIFMHKNNVLEKIKKEVFNEAFMNLAFMVKDRSLWSNAAFENIKRYPMIIWIECIGVMKEEQIVSLLNNYGKELPSSLIGLCVINLPEDTQLKALEQYKKYLKVDDGLFSNLYYSLSDKAKLKLKEFFPNKIADDILLELEDLNEEDILAKLTTEHESLMKLAADDLVEFILLKSRKLDTLTKFLEIFSEKINECSIFKFKLLITRYRYLANYRSNQYFDDEEQESKMLTDSALFQLFKNKFRQIGVEQTLLLFDNKTFYNSNKFTADVIFEFLDIAYSSND